MKKVFINLVFCIYAFTCKAQIDTVLLTQEAVHLFPSFPVKSSYTSLIDRRAGFAYAYSANMESGLGIYDVATIGTINASLNLPISTFNGLDVATIEQRGNSLVIGIGDFQVNNNPASGIAILDISNPLLPGLKDLWDSAAFTHGISHLCIDGNYVYASTMTDGVLIFDISDEQHIVFKSHLQLDLNFPSPSGNAHNARGLKVKNDTLYVCFDRGGLRAIDVTDKNNPVEFYKYINTSLNSQAAAAYNDIVIKNNYAFVSVDYCGLEVIDISALPYVNVQWYNPWNCNNTNWSGAALHTNELILANQDSLLFVSAGQSDLFVFDVTNPSSTSRIGEFVHLNDTLASHGLDVYQNKVILSFIHTPVHIPPFTPFFSDPGGLKILSYQMQTVTNINAHAQDARPQPILYPNPNYENYLTIESKSQIDDIKIMDLLGQCVYRNSAIPAGQFKIETSAWARGTYMVSIIDAFETHHLKLIIER